MRKSYTTSLILFLGLIIISGGLSNCEKTTTISEDQDPPEFTSGPNVQNITSSTAEIYWETDEPADAKVYYKFGSEDWSSVADKEYRMNHSITLGGLHQDTLYSYYVESKDFFGNGPTSSSVDVFRTNTSGGENQPTITFGPEVIKITDSSAVIYWETDEPANAKVNYRTGSEDWLSVTDDEYRMNHGIAITGLSPNSEYSYYVESVDFFGNGPTSSSESSFRTHHNAESLTLIGWDYFESAEYDSAAHYFLSAVDYNSSFPEGYIGLGWTYNYTEQLFEAVSAFTDALTIKDSLTDALAGRSAGYIALNDYDSSIEDAEKLLGIDSLYIFEHDTSVNYLDVHLFAAQSYFHIGDYENAQIHVDYIDPDNGLNSADSTTWVVDGVQYEDYIEALLNLIQKLVGIFGG